MAVTASEIKPYKQKGWDLSDLLPSAEEAIVTERLAELEVEVERFESQRDELSADVDREAFRGWVRRYESILERLYVLSAYGSLWFASDTQSPAALAYKNRMETALTAIQNRVLFFSLWWKALDDDVAERLLPTADENADDRHYLQDLRRMKPHTLEESVEQLINVKDTNGISAVLTIYSMLTNKLEFTVERDGETKTVTRDELMAFVYSPKGEDREMAYRELYRVFGDEALVLSQIYSHRVRDWYDENVEMRDFKSPIAVRNSANDVPDRAVNALLDVCSESVDIFRRYFRMKADWLGLEKLRRYDLYAPLASSDRQIPYEDAQRTVFETLADFHPELVRQAERVFADDHVDSEIRPGKKGGAFCATVLPSQTPWVLLNYTGKLRDVSTMAHELGHAIHSLMAEEHSLLTQHSSLPLAETASVFAEMLLTDRMLREESDPLARREILASTVDDIYATVMRQAFFVRFETAAHDAIRGGTAPDALDELYLSTLADQFGDSVEVPPEFRHEWVSIPHIYQTPFYCYAYSFGQLLVLALYQRYKEEGDAFVPGYLRLLAHGGSRRPQEILEEVGVDMTEPDFWRGGFRVVSGFVDELAEIGTAGP